MPKVYLAVGSNLGDRKANIEKAKTLLKTLPDIHFLKSSACYETDPVGGPAQGKYLNAVWEIETHASPKILMEELLRIEAELGRKRTVRNAPRTIDLDILFYGDLTIAQEGLTLPHPRMRERWFVLKPLADLCPDFRHPALNKTVSELLEALLAAH